MKLERFSKKQLISLRDSTKRTNIWHGSVRSGKTFASMIRFLAFCHEAPEGPLVMIGKTSRTLKRNVIDPLVELVGHTYFKVSHGRGEATLFNRLIYLASANDKRAEEKIRGGTFSGAYGDEVTLWPESFFTMLLSRLSVKGAKGFYTTNPDSPFHWLKTKYIDRAGNLDLIDFSFELDDNETLDPEFKDALRQEYTGLFYKRFIEGLWVQAEGAIYDMFDNTLHVTPHDMLPEIESMDKIFFGIDYGTSNPCVFLLIGQKGNNIYVFDEYYYDGGKSGRQKTDAQYVADFEKKFGKYAKHHGTRTKLIVDPSAASFITALKGRGFRATPGNNEVLDGIRNVSTILSQERLEVSDRCVNLIKEFQSYVWDARAQQRGEDKPLQENDHGPDALRYGVQTVVFNKTSKKLSKAI